jgi:CSLREA domain-containing protein
LTKSHEALVQEGTGGKKMSKNCAKNSVLCSSVRPLLIVALLASLVVALPSPEATADVGIAAGTTITVNTTTDIVLPNDGRCSLREAITAANLNTESGATLGECPGGSGNDTVVLDSETYNLTSGDLDINSNIAIQGAGSDKTIIDGGHIDRVLNIASGSVDISGVAIRNGTIIGIGGGIYNNGVLALTNCVLHHNTSSISGGGIYSNGPTTLTGTTLRDNKANGGSGGGYFGIGLLTVTGSTIRDNRASASGGGLYNPVAMIMLADSTVRENRANGGSAGGVHCRGLTMTDSTVVTNTASTSGGGIYASGPAMVTLTNSSVNGNKANTGPGGGIYASGPGTVTMTNSNVNGNTANASPGGGIFTMMRLTMTDSHVDDNMAGGPGGGVWAVGAGFAHNSFRNVTISQRQRGKRRSRRRRLCYGWRPGLAGGAEGCHCDQQQDYRGFWRWRGCVLYWSADCPEQHRHRQHGQHQRWWNHELQHPNCRGQHHQGQHCRIRRWDRHWRRHYVFRLVECQREHYQWQ